LSEQSFLNFSSPKLRQRIALFFLWLIIAVGIILIRSIILPFLLASLLAYVVHPLVSFLGKIEINSRPIPRALSVIIIYLIFAGAIFLICTFFIPQLYIEMVRLAKDLTIFINSIDEDFVAYLGRKIEDFFRTYQLPLEIIAPTTSLHELPKSPDKQNWISIDLLTVSRDLLNNILFHIKSETKNILTSAQHMFTQFISTIFMTLLVFMITGFLLVDIKLIKKFVFSLVPPAHQDDFRDFLTRLDTRLAGVVRGQLTICVINAFLTLIGLLIFKVKFAIILATIAGIFSIVPIFGSIASTIPIVLVSLTISPLTALCSLLWIIFIHILEANFLNPKIMGYSAKIHPILIILSLLTGERFYGIVGALLSVPIMSIIITIFSSILGKTRLMDEGVANLVQNDTITT
jgi:putative heme transporter